MPIRRQRYLPHVDDDDDDNYGDAREQSRAGQAGGECCCSWQQGRQPGGQGGSSAVGTVAGDDGLAVAHIAGRAIPCTIELSAGCQSSICSSSAQVVVQGEGERGRARRALASGQPLLSECAAQMLHEYICYIYRNTMESS